MPESPSESGISTRWQLPLLYVAQAQKELTHNEALLRIDGLIHASAVSIGDDEPPESPMDGQCWIVGTKPSGAWATQSNALALRAAGGWRFIAPKLGLSVYLESTGRRAVFNADEWKESAPIAAPVGGTTVDSQARAAINSLIQALTVAGLS